VNDLLRAMRDEAAAIAARMQRPSFYSLCGRELSASRTRFFAEPLVARLTEDVSPFLADAYGHGMGHARAVAVEAGAIVLAEAAPGASRRLLLLAHLAGLVHDVARLEEDHAAAGAERARAILQDYPLEEAEVARVVHAVAAHEAFGNRPESPDPDAGLLAGALYDADKFRWGPDTFLTTLWEICAYREWPPAEILARFPAGVERVRQVAETFRTGTGQAFGPEFIEIGLAIAGRLYQLLRERVPAGG